MSENMKSSGIKWIKDIPNSWNTIKVKHLATDKNSLFLDGDWIESDVIEESGIRYLTTGNVGVGYYKEQGSGYISEKTFRDLHCLKVLPYDLMVSRLNEPIGRACIVPNNESFYVVAVDNVIIRPNKNFNKRFLMYVMNTDGYAENGNIIARGATMSRVSRSQLGQFWISYPELSEQTLIANFLDEQCKKIDSIVTDIENQIEILQKYKKSLITETVTKGLDKSVSMKDSGIEWIGDIPENWEVKRLKFLTVIKDGTHDTPDYVDEGDNTYPLITSKYIDYDRKTICFDEAKHISYDDFISIYKRSNVEKGDIIMPMIGTIGNPVIVETAEKFAIKNVALFKTCNDMVSAKFIYYQFYSDVLLEQFSLMKKGGVQSFVSLEILGNLFFIDTSHIVKRQLVKYLDVQCSKIDSIIESKKEQLTKITQHRKSLIYEYVTGKKRVKGAQSNGN